MTIYGTILPGAISVARSALLAGNLNERAKQKLRVIDWHRAHGSNVSLTARRFGLDRKTVRRWVLRLKNQGPKGLNDLSHRPRRLRQLLTSPEVIFRAVSLRKQYPAWSKYKIQVLLAKENINISASTIGRILKRRGMINLKISRKRKRAALWPKARFPRGMKISSPGDMVQMDTKHIVLTGGRRFYQFSAIDVLSKRKILKIYSSESSRNGADFLLHCFREFPFLIKAVQTDNGAPFLKNFDRFCKEKNLPHYFIYPRTPKQNTYVEISNGADKREFYQQGNVCSDLEVMRKKIKEWESVWNEIRPHQALNYLTPNAYLEKWQTGRLPTRDVISLQS